MLFVSGPDSQLIMNQGHVHAPWPGVSISVQHHLSILSA